MKFKTGLALLITAALLVTSGTGLAQKKSQNQAQTDQRRPVRQDRTYDRDRSQDHGRADQKDQMQGQDRAKTKDQVQLKDRDIYGYQLMTEQERNEYREQLKKAETSQDRQQITAEHGEKLQARAESQGVNINEAEESE
jgi:hypothetical protein